MSRATGTIIGVGFWLALATLLANTLLAYANLRTIAENNARVDRTREVVVLLGRTLSALKDAETGQRGYLLTGEDRYLSPYRAAAAEAVPFDLIVSDIGLPDGSGLELMRRVVSLRGSVRSIALTGYGMEDDIVRSRDAGFTAHMTKPIDFTKLEAMIQQITSP